MGSERFYEEMVSESDASYNSLSPDGSLTLSPGGSPKPKVHLCRMRRLRRKGWLS